MSIAIECITMVLRKDKLRQKYTGGLEAFYAHIPNGTMQEDVELVSVGFMSGRDAKFFIEFVCKNGMQYTDGKSDDFAVIHMFFGNYYEVEWLDRDQHHCWFQGTMPTHTNLYTPVFKKHKVLTEDNDDARWWNNLSDPWKNILYHNYQFRGEKQSEKLHSLFYIGYKMQFIGDITIQQIEDIRNLQLIRVDGASCSELGNLKDLDAIKDFTNLREITFKRTKLASLKGIEKLSLLSSVQIDGVFSDLSFLSGLESLKKVNLYSPNIISIKEIMNMKLEHLNINSGKTADLIRLLDYYDRNPDTHVTLPYEDFDKLKDPNDHSEYFNIDSDALCKLADSYRPLFDSR